jgi:hypothetical protein
MALVVIEKERMQINAKYCKVMMEHNDGHLLVKDLAPTDPCNRRNTPLHQKLLPIPREFLPDFSVRRPVFRLLMSL